MLTDTYADMCIVALSGINKRVQEFDPWLVYEIMKEMPLFQSENEAEF